MRRPAVARLHCFAPGFALRSVRRAPLRGPTRRRGGYRLAALGGGAGRRWLVARGAGLLHRRDALVHRHEGRGLVAAYGAAGGGRQGEGSGTGVVGEVADRDQVVVAEAEVARLDLAAHLGRRGADRLDAVLRVLHHRRPGLRRVADLDQVVGHVGPPARVRPSMVRRWSGWGDGRLYRPSHMELDGIDPSRIPVHVACVMDGNGRWASKRGLPRTEGHAAGEEALFDTVEGALELGIKWLTVYAFSTENWK